MDVNNECVLHNRKGELIAILPRYMINICHPTKTTYVGITTICDIHPNTVIHTYNKNKLIGCSYAIASKLSQILEKPIERMLPDNCYYDKL